jgi:glycosyltransferase involved in cell wall biosynthesis
MLSFRLSRRARFCEMRAGLQRSLKFADEVVAERDWVVGVQSRLSISVIIPAHNIETLLGEQLEALCRQDYAGSWDVTVVDNRSADRTADVAASFQGRLPLRIVPALERASPAYARNVGVQASAGDLLVFVDADDVADPGLLSAYAARSAEYFVMGGQLDDAELNDPVAAAWRFSLTADGLPRILGRFSFFVTANCAIRREVFERIGGFDEALPFVHEDVDFSIRAELAGFKIGWVPEAVVHYRHRDTLAGVFKQQFVYGRGSVHLFKRYRDVATPDARVQAWRLLLWLVIGIRHIVGGRRRLGRWLSFAGFITGQVVESIRQRTWYVG